MTGAKKGFAAFWQSSTGRRVVRIMEPSKWWIALFLVGLVAVNVWAFTLRESDISTSQRVGLEETARLAEHRATANSQFVACLKSRPVLLKFNRYISRNTLANQLFQNALIENSKANLAFVDHGTALYRQRVTNLHRLAHAAQDANAAQILFPVPTVKDCYVLKHRLLKR